MSKTVLGPRESGDFISKNARHVSICNEAITKLAKFSLVTNSYEELQSGKLRKYCITEHGTYPKTLNQHEAFNYVFFLNTVNFNFWYPPRERKWEVKFQGKSYHGTFALYAAVAKAYAKGIQIFDPNVYHKFSVSELNDLLMGENGIPIPMIEKRVDCLKEVGTVLLKEFNGSFENCVLQAGGRAQTLIEILVENFPCFDDSCDYKGRRVSFHMRAQMLVDEVYGLYKREGSSKFSDMDSITVFAEYRIPQTLIHYGILEYTPHLMSIIINDETLESGCEYEVEIRGCSIKAADLLVEEIHKFMQPGDPVCNAITVDNLLWSYYKDNIHGKERNRYHKVKSIFY